MNRYYIVRDRLNGKLVQKYADFVHLRNLYAQDFDHLMLQKNFFDMANHFNKFKECGADMDRFEILSIFEAELNQLKFD